MTDEQLQSTKRSRRGWWLLATVVTLLLLALLPPFLNINRFRRRIAASIGGSLGRPVHIDSVGFRILPTPGFTIENFVVGENPAFGDEPFLLANTVTATLHISSLWRGHLEFATISLDEPHVNLVRNAAGQWNVESILLQASQIHTAPTAQRSAGGLPRFPYIEATQARVNIKMGDEKMPFSLTDSKIALWLSQPETWHVRMEARPLRTDMNATDTGLVQVEGTFQRAATLDAIPLQLSARWRDAQIGDVSHMLIGENAGWRGSIDAEANVTGRFGDAQIDARLHLDEVRRAEFEPKRALALDVACTANPLDNLHSFDAIRCALPLGDGNVLMEGNIANLRVAPQPALKFTVQQVPASQLLEIARHATNRIAPGLTAEGTIDGTLFYGPPAAPAKKKISSPAKPVWQGSLALPTLTLAVPGIPGSLTVANLHLHTADSATAGRNHRSTPAFTGAVLDPVTLALGGPAPAMLDGSLHHDNYTLHLRGSVIEPQLLALAHAVPQFGDGIENVLPVPAQTTPQLPVYIDATAQRSWSGLGIYAGASPLDQRGEIWTTAAQRSR
jgi:AsmA protein